MLVVVFIETIIAMNFFGGKFGDEVGDLALTLTLTLTLTKAMRWGTS